MSGDSVLHVTEFRHSWEPSWEHSFAVFEALGEIDPGELDRIFCSFRQRGEQRTLADGSLFGVFWPDFAVPLAATPGDPTSLTHLVPLYCALSNKVERTSPDRIVCHDLPADYRAIVRDVGNQHDVEVQADSQSRLHPLKQYLRTVLMFALLLASQLIALILGIIRDPPRARLVYVPLVNRLHSIDPIIEATDDDFLVVVPNVSLFARLKGTDVESISGPVVHITRFTSIRTMLAQVRVFVWSSVNLLVFQSLQEEVADFLREEFAVEMPTAVDYCVGNLLGKLSAVPYAVLMKEVVQQTGCERVVINSMGTKQLGMVRVANDAGVHTFHVPHTVTTGYEVVPPSKTDHIVPGEIARQYLFESEQVETVENIVPAGRPHLAALNDGDTEPSPVEPPLDIVIATQPFRDDVRQEFVTTVLDAFDEFPFEKRIVVKIHPNEEKGFYEHFARGREDVTVRSDGLNDLLENSDLTFTINSNVGLESVVLGTPACCVNLWSPVVRLRPYATMGPIPTLTSTDEVEAFVRNLTPERIDELARRENVFVGEEYVLDDDCLQEVVRVISGEG